MIIEYKIDYRSSSQIYEKMFLQVLKKHSLEGGVLRDGFILKCYVVAKDSKEFEDFAVEFSKSLPHSIFLYDTEVNVVESLPDENMELEEQDKLSLPFCLNCLDKAMDKNGKDYYNIFTSCDLCGYDIEGKNKNYKEDFEKIAKLIKDGGNIKINTFYGNFTVGIPSKVCNDIDFDLIAYDYVTIKKYANVEDFEIKALASIEKPFIKLKKQIKFTMDFEDVEKELIRFKLPDDLILHFLMQELNELGINLIFITIDDIDVQQSLILTEPEDIIEPIEVVVSQDHIAIVKGGKGLPEFSKNTKKIIPAVGAFYSIIKEHKLTYNDMAGIYLSKKYQNSILIHGEKYGTKEYLSLNFKFESIADIFSQIQSTNETGEKIIENFNKKFPEHFDRITSIFFEDTSFNIYKLWGIISIILDFTSSNDVLEAAKIMEDNSISFLGSKGPRIDYKLIKIDDKTVLDPLMAIRSAMSFKLAGVDVLTLSYGVVESFAEFLSCELDDMKENMKIDAVAIAGSLLENKKLFSRLSIDCSKNHNIYFNNQLLVDQNNIFYGDSPNIE